MLHSNSIKGTNFTAIYEQLDQTSDYAIDAAIGIELQKYAETLGWDSGMKIWPLQFIVLVHKRQVDILNKALHEATSN